MGLINWFKNAQEQHEKDLKERNKKFEETKQKLENEKLKTQAEIAEHKKRIEENKAKLAAKKANKTSANSNSVPKSNALTVKVTGTNYRNQKEILSLGSLNPEYSLNKVALIKKYPEGNTIYEYIFPKHTATFEFEPTNEFDPNAIKVMIKGVHVGYVKKGSCARIKNLINQNKIKSIFVKNK